MKIMNNNLKSEFITIASRPNLGKTSLLTKIAQNCVNLNKKVLFFSLESNEELLLKKMKIETNKNLLIEDNVINDITKFNKIIEECNPNIVIVDYIQLLPDNEEVINILKKISIEKDIPIIITSQLNKINDSLDMSNISLEDFESNNKSINSLIKHSDKFIVLYNKNEIMIRNLKNNYNENIGINEILIF